LDDVIPAARATGRWGSAEVTWTAFRAPIFPEGVDVLEVRVRETAGRAGTVTLALDVTPKVTVGMRNAKLKNRTVLVLPRDSVPPASRREWGCASEANALPGWGKPQGKCDPAFRNIRAGMGGAPIQYRFTVAPKSACNVALGFCESHWSETGKRLMQCQVEGAPPQELDPIAKWGRHQPGVLWFKGSDENGDGQFEIIVKSTPNAGDRNPILNALWIFPASETPNPAQIIAGAANANALHYVAVGGEKDQTLYPPGKLEFALKLPAGGVEELVFLVGCNGASVPTPPESSWTPQNLRRAARDVWRNWVKKE
jgi:hypothetical protein